jgi:PHAX RNA-binding domain
VPSSTIDTETKNSYDSGMSEQQASTGSTDLIPATQGRTVPQQERQASTGEREPSQYETGLMIADRLGESDEASRQQIGSLVRVLGRTQARALLAETMQMEEQGGSLVPGGSTRRTPGEIFFHLAATKGTPKPGKALNRSGSQQHHQPADRAGLPSHRDVAHQVAEQLGETGASQRRQIHTIVWALGPVQTWALVREALEVDAGEGMMTPDGSRRRTVGGIFFHLAYSKGTPEPGKVLTRVPPPSTQQKRKSVSSVQPAPANTTPEERKPLLPPVKEAPVLPFLWQDRLAALAEAATQKGTANVKITVIGRPGKIVDRGTCVVTIMESTRIPALPKGLPTPPATPTTYTVSIASKQWKKVAETIIADPDDLLIVEGFPTTDPHASAIAVFATNITTRNLQHAQKEAKKAP